MSIFVFLLFIGLIVLFFKFRNLKSDMMLRMKKLERTVAALNPDEPFKEKETAAEPEEMLIPADVEIAPEPEKVIKPPVIPATVKPTVAKTPEIEIPPEAKAPEAPVAAETRPGAEATPRMEKPAKKKSTWAARWKTFKQNVDWEQFTGKKLTAWLGGVSLFVAAGFFVKFSIERDLIPMEVRLATGALIGIVLIILSGRFKHEKYTIMRHTLVSCGIGVLYAVVYAAIYYEYLTKPIGFGLLALVSAAAFVLSVYHKGIPISVLGALGAYATPILVSTGSGNIVMLSVYLGVVNIGIYQVVRYLKSQMLLITACYGTMITLALGIGAYYSRFAGHTIAGVWVANLVLFTAFLGHANIDPRKNVATRWAGYGLYLAALLMGLVLLNKPDWSALFTATAAVFGATALAFRNSGWYSKVIPYAAMTFVVALLWALFRFSPHHFSMAFVLFILYGVAGGLGPVVLVRKYGAGRMAAPWFKTFPVAVMVISFISFFRSPDVSFWFWPMILCLQLIGIGISLIIRAFVQIGLLVLLFIAGGLFWIFNIPAALIGFGFFGFVLFAGIIMCVGIFWLIKKSPGLIEALSLNQGAKKSVSSLDRFQDMDQWLMAAPAVAAFVLLGASFVVRHPLFPHPGMVTLVCFLGLALFLSRRIAFQPPGVIALLAAAVAQSVWIFNTGGDGSVLFAAVAWSSALFLSALVLPFAAFRDFTKWKQMVNAWALFEAFQGIFVLYSSSTYWDHPLVKWVPLVMALLKLPAVVILLRRLNGRPERNSILAFHGGALLFYISALPVLVLDHGWIGLTFVFEAAALLWLNRRIEHPGLRWVAVFMAPLGLGILIVAVPLLKGAEGLAVLNSAVFSVAAAVVALGAAVKLSAYPQRRLGRVDLPNCFRWLAVGTGFYFLNLVIADIFAGPGQGFRVMPGQDFLQALCYAFTWSVFGAALWSARTGSMIMRWVGFAFISLGGSWLFFLPVLLPQSIAGMKPFLNLGLLAYLPLMGLLYFLFFKEPREDFGGRTRNIFLALFLVAGFMLFKVESSTIFQNGFPFEILRPRTPSKAVASAAGWLIYGLGLLLWRKPLDRPFRIAGVVLILAGTVRAMILPFMFRSQFGMMTPIANSPSILFLFVVACLIYLTLKNWLPLKNGQQTWPLEKMSPRPFWGIVLALTAFGILNIEIASAFGIEDKPFSMLSHGSLSMQLAYSIGWLIFSIGLMVVGIRWDTVKVRWASIILLVVTSVKIFILDLWKLGQLYRVGSFVGLAVVLIMVSFLYQRFLSEGRKDEK